MTYSEYKTASKECILDYFYDSFAQWAREENDDKWNSYLQNRFLNDTNPYTQRWENVQKMTVADYYWEIWNEYADEIFADDKEWEKFVFWLELEEIAPSEFDDED